MRGGDVRGVLEPSLLKSCEPQPISSKLVSWKTVLSSQWKVPGEHINVLEGKAACLGLRWRTRTKANLNRRAAHFLDSQVIMNILAKGRTSSSRLLPVILRANAIILAGHLHMILGYVRSKDNPADRPSRVKVPLRARGARLKAQVNHA